MWNARHEGTAGGGCLALREVIEGPLHEIARRFSRFLSDRWPHTALVVFTKECTGRPRKVAGATEMVNKVTIDELEQLKALVEPGLPLSTTAAIGGAARAVWAVRDPVGTLLVLVPRGSRKQFPQPAALSALFGIVATSISQQVAQASPDYLAESRAASSERARTITEMATAHESALVAILNTLRATALDDRRARVAATESASVALVALRSAQKSDLALSEEPAPAAFTKLRRDIRHLLKHHEAHVEFVPLAKAARPLPGEVAYAARAMTRTAVLALTAQPVRRACASPGPVTARHCGSTCGNRNPGAWTCTRCHASSKAAPARSAPRSASTPCRAGEAGRHHPSLRPAGRPDRGDQAVEPQRAGTGGSAPSRAGQAEQGHRGRTRNHREHRQVPRHRSAEELEVSSRGEAAALALNGHEQGPVAGVGRGSDRCRRPFTPSPPPTGGGRRGRCR
ncbi:hypothetical protein ACR6C2_28745 [Streptomyces sp. INA 01156]